jgi:hypothetical protein
MAQGIFPTERHDLTAWSEENEYEKAQGDRAGKDLGFKAVCLTLKLDWAELVNSVGLPGWRDGQNPCAFCFAPPV